MAPKIANLPKAVLKTTKSLCLKKVSQVQDVQK